MGEMKRRFLHREGRTPRPPPWSYNPRTSWAWRKRSKQQKETQRLGAAQWWSACLVQEHTGSGFIPSERLQNPACEGSFASSLALVLSCWVILCLNHSGKIPLKCNQYLQPYFMGQTVPNCTNTPQMSLLQRPEQVTLPEPPWQWEMRGGSSGEARQDQGAKGMRGWG